MNGRILRLPGERHSILDIGQADREKIANLGRVAKTIFSAQDQDHWAQAGDPDLLPHVVAGAIILERIGQHSEAIIIEDDGAHLAFMTCSALTVLTPDLNRACLRTLEDTLKILAMCCPIQTTVQDLPPLECLPNFLPKQSRHPSTISTHPGNRHESSGHHRSRCLGSLPYFSGGEFATILGGSRRDVGNVRRPTRSPPTTERGHVNYVKSDLGERQKRPVGGMMPSTCFTRIYVRGNKPVGRVLTHKLSIAV